MLTAIFSIFGLIVAIRGQDVRQCTCAELETCKTGVINEIQQCFGYCKPQVNLTQETSTLNISRQNYDFSGLKSCVLQSLNSTQNCFDNINSELCTNKPNVSIGKTDSVDETNVQKLNFIKQRILVRVKQYSNGEAFGQGLMKIVNEMISGSPLASCVNACMGGSNSQNCVQNLGCALKQPNGNIFLALTSTCNKDLQKIKNNLVQCING